MNILVTGASGFLGRRAASYFASLGWEVLAPTHAQLDITDESGVLSWFTENRPEVVLHCAAVSDTGACQREPGRTARINVDGSVNLAKACAKMGAKLIFCSSDQVYSGSMMDGPHSENEALTPNNVYACQKLLAEEQCAEICPNTVSLRLSWMYAENQLPNEHSSFMISLLDAIRDETKVITWPIHDRRGITNVHSVIRNLPAAIDLPAGVYNFGAENDADTYHLVECVLSRLNLKNASERLTPNTEAFAAAPRDIRMDIAKIKQAGIEFESTEQGVYETLKAILG